ncbi:MAG: glycogen/starch synthase [Planctomycetota bacterium]|nr:glycogen/starch synthase [Planctomycetota bacterium]
MRIAFITPEFLSLVRRTNLAGVAESLSQALAQAGNEVRVFLPWTRDVDTDPLGELDERAEIKVRDGQDTETFRIVDGRLGELAVSLVENERFFGSRHPYGDNEGPYPDNWRRYALFARAVLESFEPLDFHPEVMHCMDWTTGLIPVFHKLEYVNKNRDHPASEAGTYFAIHNLAIQGAFEREILPKIGIPHRHFHAIGGIELGGKVNFLKAGAEYATIIGTHSPSHAEKIQQRDRGYGLEDTFLRRRKELVGITNGIDYQAWNPETDPMLPARFGAKDRELAGKRKCKSALQAALKLDHGPRTPLACTIGRWDADSGFDLVAEVLNQILERNVELVVMGSGNKHIGDRLLTMESAFMGRMRLVEGYNAHTAHLMMGGADMMLLPSHYQPSSPLFAIAMRYGVVPVVYAKSGLEDTVVNLVEDKRRGTGIHFEPYSSEGLMEGVNAAIKAYREATKWKSVVRRCLSQDFSWETAAAQYLKAYRRVTRRVKARQTSA